MKSSDSATPGSGEAPRGLQVAVGALAAVTGLALVALAALGLYRQLVDPSGFRRPEGLLAAIFFLAGGLCLGLAWRLVRGRRPPRSGAAIGTRIPRRPLPAALLSLLAPGLGQLYNAQPRRAAGFFLAAVLPATLLIFGVTSRSFQGFATMLGLSLAARLASVIEAAFAARRAGAVDRRGYHHWAVYAALLVAFQLLPLALRPWQVVKTFYIPTETMAPALEPGDRVAVDLRGFAARAPHRGDVAVFRSPEDDAVSLVKRVVALGGEIVELRAKVLYVDGQPLPDPWGVHRDPRTFSGGDPRRRKRDHFGPYEVPIGSVFVLGDNRDYSYDSRYFGAVDLQTLVGKVLFIYWSADRSRIARRVP